MPGKKHLLIASTGGHLTQLDHIARAEGSDCTSLWVSFDNPQSRSILLGRRHLYVPYIGPRDLKAAMRAIPLLLRATKSEKFDLCLSTGSAIAIPGLLIARLRRIPSTYIESVSRTKGPSFTGRIVAKFRLADQLFTQHRSWAGGRWKLRRSVLAAYQSQQRDEFIKRDGLKIFVSLGTIKPYRFDSAVDAVLRIASDKDQIVWQVGCTNRQGLPGKTFSEIAGTDFENQCKAADVVITHAGVGTILNLLSWGIFPIAIVRRSARSEHVDDHQEQIARVLIDAGTGLARESGNLKRTDLYHAARTTVHRLPDQMAK